MNIRPGRLVAGFAIILASALLGVLVATTIYISRDKVCKGVEVSGVAVGGLSKAEAVRVVHNWAREVHGRRIVLTALDTRWAGAFTSGGKY